MRTCCPRLPRGRGAYPGRPFRLLSASWRVARSQGDETITAAHFKRACQLEQIDDLGPRADGAEVSGHPGPTGRCG
jgi:hypothetical protein